MASTGIIRTPNYPATYPNYLNCQYRILAAPGDYVDLKFTDQFGMEGASV